MLMNLLYMSLAGIILFAPILFWLFYGELFFKYSKWLPIPYIGLIVAGHFYYPMAVIIFLSINWAIMIGFWLMMLYQIVVYK